MQKDIAGIAVDVQIKGTFMAQIYRANEGENHVFESKMIVSTERFMVGFKRLYT